MIILCTLTIYVAQVPRVHQARLILQRLFKNNFDKIRRRKKVISRSFTNFIFYCFSIIKSKKDAKPTQSRLTPQKLAHGKNLGGGEMPKLIFFMPHLKQIMRSRVDDKLVLHQESKNQRIYISDRMSQ